MRHNQIYKKIVVWISIYTIAIVASGSWLYLLRHSHTFYSWETALEIATPHIFGMGLMAFVLLHFLLFSKKRPSPFFTSIFFTTIFAEQAALFIHPSFLKPIIVGMNVMLFAVFVLFVLRTALERESVPLEKKS